MFSRPLALFKHSISIRRLAGLALLGLLLMAPGPAAWADSWRDRGYDRHYGGRFDGWRFGHDRYDYRRYDFRDRHSSRYWPRSRRQRDNYFSISFGHSRSWHRYDRRQYRHYRDNDMASFVGGVVLGSLLSNAVQQRPDRNYEARPVPSVVRSSRVSRSVITSSNRPRLLRDLQGRCFEISYDGSGNQRRVQVDDSRCHF